MDQEKNYKMFYTCLFPEIPGLVIPKDLKLRVDTAVETLSELSEEIICMKYGIGDYLNPMSDKDIAKHLDVSDNLVKKRLPMALNSLKSESSKGREILLYGIHTGFYKAEELDHVPIEELDPSIKAFNGLNKSGINTILDLIKTRDQDIQCESPRLRRSTINEIRKCENRFLEENHISLKEVQEKWNICLPHELEIEEQLEKSAIHEEL